MSCTNFTALPEAPQAKQWKTPFSTETDMDARRSPWMGQQTSSLPQRPSLRSTP
jgi:hypothetical protein